MPLEQIERPLRNCFAVRNAGELRSEHMAKLGKQVQRFIRCHLAMPDSPLKSRKILMVGQATDEKGGFLLQQALHFGRSRLLDEEFEESAGVQEEGY